MDKVERNANEKLKQAALYADGLRGEMDRLKVENQNEVDEVRIQSELRINDLEMKCRRQNQRISVFEKDFAFPDVLQTFNEQMVQLEQENSILLTEIKHISKVNTVLATVKTKELPVEKIIKSLRNTVKRLSTQLQQA